MTIYYIGGSPCSGKSTVAEALAARHGLHYFKVDDHLERYMALAAQEGKPACTQVTGMSPEEIWMRAPQVQCREELRIYEEIFGYVLADLAAIDAPGVITEGAAYLPALIRARGVPVNRYLSLTPEKGFQVCHYSRRTWVPHVLAGCSDQAQAFANWMERDALFAEAVRRQCGEAGYVSLINDGSVPAEALIAQIAAHFGLA